MAALLIAMWPGPGALAAPRVLHLEVWINGRPVGFILRVTEDAAGLAADADELRNVGIAANPGAGEVRLDAIPGIAARIDEAAQILAVTAMPEARAPHRIPAVEPTLLEEAESGTGAVLNYGLWLEQGTAEGDRVNAATFGLRLYAPLGTLNHGWQISGGAGMPAQEVRLDSWGSLPIPSAAATLRLGDLVTGGPAWTRPVRLGGLQIARDFSLRPDLVTVPLPAFTGTAAVPSTVDVFFDSVRRVTMDVPEGPFVLSDLPLAGGGGVAEVVVRDTAGRESRMSLPFLVSDALLPAGMADYEISVGRPRLGIGTEEDRYGPTVYSSGSLSYGLSDRWLLSFHGETGGHLHMGALGATAAVGTRGTMSLALGLSRSEAGRGRIAEASADLAFGIARVAARTRRATVAFSDIARESAEVESDPDDPVEGPGELTAGLRALDQLSVSLPTARGWFSLLYARAGHAGTGTDRSYGISYSRRLGEGDATLATSVVTLDSDEDRDAAVSLSLVVPLRGRRQLGTDARFGNRRRLAATLASTAPPEPGRWRWQAQAGMDGGRGLLAGRAMRTGQYGDMELGLRRDGARTAVGAQIDGALVAAGGGVFLSGPIDDAFAVVNVGAPGVPVFRDQRPAGVSDPFGRVLVTGLYGYQPSTVSIDPLNLPIDATVPATSARVVPRRESGVVVDFGIDPDPAAATVTLVDAAGLPLPVGETVVLTASGRPFLVGYDGMVYVEGLDATNRLELHRPDGSGCVADFAYAQGAPMDLGVVSCR